jgi:outer membrane receptor protein involved in Fe transport
MKFDSGFRGSAAYSYQQVENSGTGERLSNSPVHMLRGGLSVPLKALGFISAELRYESSRVTVYSGNSDSFILTNINYRSGEFWEYFRVSLLIRNIFEEEYSTPAGFEHYQEKIKHDGRNYVLTVEISF